MSEYIVRITDDMPYEIKAELNAWYIESEPIVRCRDCKHADEIMTRYAGMQYACMRFDDATVTPDGFCAWAERREP